MGLYLDCALYKLWVGVTKKSLNPLIYPNPLINCPIKLTYLINGQIGANPIKHN